MIETGADIEVMNPDLVICTLDDGAVSQWNFLLRPARATAMRRATGRKITNWCYSGR